MFLISLRMEKPGTVKKPTSSNKPKDPEDQYQKSHIETEEELEEESDEEEEEEVQ